MKGRWQKFDNPKLDPGTVLQIRSGKGKEDREEEVRVGTCGELISTASGFRTDLVPTEMILPVEEKRNPADSNSVGD